MPGEPKDAAHDPHTVEPDQLLAGPLRDIAALSSLPPRQRWAALANELDPRLVHQADWGALATILQQAHDHGHDVPTATRQLVGEAALDTRPAQDLRYRLVSRLRIDVDHEPDLAVDPSPQRAPAEPHSPGTGHERRPVPHLDAGPPTPRR